VSKKALITGVSGQDGSFLAELLLEKGYEVHGIIRRSSSSNTSRIDHILDDLHLHYGDMTDAESLGKIVRKVVPDEVYALAAQSHVRTSFDVPEYTVDTDAVGTLRLLDVVNEIPGVKFYQAGTSEMFGRVVEIPQSETTPFRPQSPYAIAKQFAHWTTVHYREHHKLFACNGILFNHESERRGELFVTQKIVKGLVSIYNGSSRGLSLGNLDAKRDWGYSKEYVEAMYLMMCHHTPDDYVIATGETHSVREFLDETATYLGITWQDHVTIDPTFYRLAEVDLLIGDASKAKRVLGWEPKVKFKELVRIMVDAEMKKQ
jgi:GDPmannose 4,6-dehydratase